MSKLVYIGLSRETISLDLATHVSLIGKQDRVISVCLVLGHLCYSHVGKMCSAGAALPLALLFPLNLLARLRPENPTATQGAISPCGML